MLGKNTLLGIFYGVKDSLLGICSVRHYIIKTEQNSLSKNVPSKDAGQNNLANFSNVRNNQLNYRKQNVARSNIIYCCILNGILFLLSILMFNFILIPGLHYLFTFIFKSDHASHSELWSWIHMLLSYTFSVFWIMPIFFLSKFVNIFFFQEIADSSFRGRIQTLNSIPKLVADFLFSIFIQAIFLIQARCMAFIPIYGINFALELLHLSLLYSMYSFDYKWFNMGWELHKRLHFIESNWPYFVGFGLPLAILTTLFDDYIISGGLFSLVFPLFIISSNVCKPKKGFCDLEISLFRPSVWISNIFLKSVLFLWQSNYFVKARIPERQN